ncbi:DUF2188 domain-containing protein [Oceanobacillus neutriphilus]|uniref:DUF2188 domain-containing protein n=1 Tax=Oceanobacillus neutriphilus TaxID=531815 RepID=A0ABQ2P080_9BACI|nr:DUF2188 domain-containing protein [Oceanobacillus neutriphilus]GGP14965.1 hypothetical protein GCM10011346_41080 [Oceanobacillus neutriphilus]
MVWTMNDYPSSMKNLEKPVLKKAIDIANSMLDDGYQEGRAIPIAIEQAKEWYNNADKEEIRSYEKSGKPTQRSKEGKEKTNNPERLEEGEEVYSHEEGWAVASTGSSQASEIFKNKEEAVKRAAEIAKNKGTSLTIYRADGAIEDKRNY